ncbi:hypothetical protein KRX52_04330 [Pseudomonas sp. MAP12]|uniref:Uncharacterized protein n=1 Tax=Geopseudomonas aromaticivorans TaxID=2849492 RepID=A0ABS6MTF1_9GAMM|nr:hypothetical protein [Pseudomonas aromaticivorans]MBV2132025.1 hypothetical protein [Pseudomonas aromaticivorans]
MIDLRNMMESGPPLRMSHLLSFLSQTGRSEICPFCRYDGGWDIHLQIEGDRVEDDALLSIFTVQTLSEPNSPHQCAGLTCPKCGHFSMISVYKIRHHLDMTEKANG